MNGPQQYAESAGLLQCAETAACYAAIHSVWNNNGSHVIVMTAVPTLLDRPWRTTCMHTRARCVSLIVQEQTRRLHRAFGPKQATSQESYAGDTLYVAIQPATLPRVLFVQWETLT